MKIVLDASAALEIAGGRPNAPGFAELLRNATSVLAPDLFLLEVANALWKLHRFGNLPPADVLPLLKEISDLVGEWKPIQELYHPALELAIRFGISVYDGCYLALAFENQASLLTLDKKLQGAAREMGVWLVGVNV